MKIIIIILCGSVSLINAADADDNQIKELIAYLHEDSQKFDRFEIARNREDQRFAYCRAIIQEQNEYTQFQEWCHYSKLLVQEERRNIFEAWLDDNINMKN